MVTDMEFPTTHFFMDERVDGKRLRDAVSFALNLHPFFCTTLKEEEGLFFLESNDNTSPVFKNEEDSFVYPGEEKANGYLWSIYYRDNKIVFCGKHVQCDGTGMLYFMNDVFLGYYSISLDRITDPKEKVLDARTYFAKDIPGLNKTGERRPVAPGALSRPEDYDVSGSDKEYCLLRLDNDTETNVFALLDVMLKRLIERFRLKTGFIPVSVAVDYRRLFKTHTDRNFVGTHTLYYEVNDSMDSIKNQFNQAIDRDAVAHSLFKSKRLTENIYKNPKEALFRMQLRSLLWDGISTPSITLTYFNRLHLDERVLYHIKDYYMEKNVGIGNNLISPAWKFKNKVFVWTI